MFRFFPIVFWTNSGQPIRMVTSAGVIDHTSWSTSFAEDVAMEQFLGKRQQWAFFCKIGG